MLARPLSDQEVKGLPGMLVMSSGLWDAVDERRKPGLVVVEDGKEEQGDVDALS